MLHWFQALMPKEHRFFEMFERHADLIVAGAARATRASARAIFRAPFESIEEDQIRRGVLKPGEAAE